ncbi:hypothetical protein BGX26_005464 [Mortierella sp. AD094]|nr:hypothetical protein BGX26_005464 [Mortierella sp. AD094]
MICRFCLRDNDVPDSQQDVVEHRFEKYLHVDPYTTVNELPTTPVADAFIANKFLCWHNGSTAAKHLVKCKQYHKSIVQVPLCKLDNAPGFDWVAVNQYIKSPGYGNCDSAYDLSLTNPLFTNKVLLENGINFSSANLRYTEIYYDIETFNAGAYSEVPAVDNKGSRIGVISMYIPSTNALHLFTYTHYAYDVEIIKSHIGIQDLTLKVHTFAHEHSICQSFITMLNDIPGLKLLSGFNSSIGATAANKKPPGYDLPFILDRSCYVYHLNIKFGVSITTTTTVK